MAIPLVLVLAGAGVAVGLIVHHSNQVAARKRATARAAAARRREQRAAQQLANAQQQLNQTIANTERTSLVTSLEGAVQKDAQSDVNNGVLNGPIMKVDCQPATAADATASIANYTCIAVTSTSSDGTEQGYRFSASINASTGTYTWHLGG